MLASKGRIQHRCWGRIRRLRRQISLGTRRQANLLLKAGSTEHSTLVKKQSTSTSLPTSLFVRAVVDAYAARYPDRVDTLRPVAVLPREAAAAPW